MIGILRNWRLLILILLVGLLAYMGVRLKWLSASLQRAESRAKRAEEYQTGRRASDEIDRRIGGDPAAAREFLRNRKP